MTISDKLNPTHNPSAPQCRRKQSQVPSGSPSSQYAEKWHIIGVRVSPVPRKHPVATVWMPSKSWNATPAASNKMALRMTVWSLV